MLPHDHVLAEIENFLGQKFQNIEDIFTLCLRLVGGLANVRNEIVPRNSPFLLHDRHQSCVEFGQQNLASLLLSLLILSEIQDHLDDSTSDALLLIIWEHVPSSL